MAPIADVLVECPGVILSHPVSGGKFYTTTKHCDGCASVPRLRAELERLRELVDAYGPGLDGLDNLVRQLRADVERKEAALRAAADFITSRFDFRTHSDAQAMVTRIDAALGGTDG